MDAMSEVYSLFCAECEDALDVGKIVEEPERGRPDWFFGGWRTDDGRWIEGDLLLRLLERFLILHRGHEIRLVPLSAWDRVQGVHDDRFRFIETPEELLDRRVEPPPGEEDSQVVPQEFLVRFVRSP